MNITHTINVPYSRKIWRGIKFGGLAVYTTTAKLKSAKISYSHIYIWRSRTEPPNLKSANILHIAISGSNAKFNGRQHFRLYGIRVHACIILHVHVYMYVCMYVNINKWGKIKPGKAGGKQRKSSQPPACTVRSCNLAKEGTLNCVPQYQY